MSDDVPPLVVVMVGTDHHRFDRLLTWAAALAASGAYRFFVQHGATPLPPQLDGAPMLAPAELTWMLRRADAAITHAGPGCIMDARGCGHVPIVVPRDPRLGEHVDDHQQRFARFISRSGMVVTASDAAELEARLRVAVLAGRIVADRHPVPAVRRFEELVEGLLHP